MAFTSLLPGQEFRAPNFPSPPPAPIEQPTEQVNGQYSNSRASYDSQSSSYENQSHGSERNSFLEQKLEYARQLRAQMERAGREQGASPEFAEKAYQAQQAYLAEQAFLEHQAYQQELTRQPRTYQPSPKPNPVRPEASAKQYDVAHAGYQTPPNYDAQEVGRIPSTYSPPVHASPPQAKPISRVQDPVAPNFEDQLARDINSESRYYLRDSGTITPEPRVVERLPKPRSPNRHASLNQPVAKQAQANQRAYYLDPAQAAPRGRETPGIHQANHASYQQEAPRQAAAHQQQASHQQQVPRQQQAVYQQPQLAQQQLAYQHQAAGRQQLANQQQAVGRQQVAYQTPTPRRQPIAHTASTAQRLNPRARPTQEPTYYEQDFPALPLPLQRVHGPNDPFILGETSSVGLQDRIEELLTKPRYRLFADRSKPLPRSTQSTDAKLLPEFKAKTFEFEHSQEQFVAHNAPRRPRLFPQQSRAARPSSPGLRPRADRARPDRARPEFIAEHSIAQARPEFVAERPITRRSDSEVRLAYQMEQRIQNGTRPSPFQQVARVTPVTPVQDPFNDGVSQFRSKPRLPAKQVSVLSGRSRSQDADDSPFEFGAQEEDLSQSPTEDFSLEGSAAERSDLELKRIDDELNRRLEELDSELASDEPDTDKNMMEDEDEDEDSLLSEMSEKLEKDLTDSQDELGDSVLDDLPDEPEEFVAKPPEKTCDEFRATLLNDSIRDISLDISPPASSIRDQFTSISRSWTDRSGNVIANGAMVDLRRGYVILDGAEGRQKIPYAKLSEADLGAIAEYWRLPKLCSVGDRGSATRSWVGQTYTWKASNLCHKPLFFENVQLERYGHSHGPFSQPVHSVAHFFVSLATVPYQTAITPANECQYALGFYRPGNCAPWLKDPVPISLSGALRQVGVSGFGGLTR